MTGPEHYREAERLAGEAEKWADADYGWMASMSTDERIARRSSDLAAAQLHATLALTAATALSGITLTLPDGSDLAADWNTAILADWRVTP